MVTQVTWTSGLVGAWAEAEPSETTMLKVYRAKWVLKNYCLNYYK